MPIEHSVLALLLPATLLAQTFVVDINNGPGTSFTTIDAAVAAVPGGSTLIVKAGNYPGFTIAQKSITVLAEARVVASPAISVTGLTAAQKVVLRYPVPNAPWVRGIAVCWQGAAFDAVNGLQLSNPVHYAHW
ncbi:MAG: hypothetical protein KDC98_15265 [Planctomycetes bacterium]|nr:hypothetical protein [Planctomycetota bacterium]